MFGIVDRIGSLIGDTATIVLLVFLLTLAAASEIWEWIVWVKLRRGRQLSQRARGIELTSLVAGTGSMMLFALFWFGMAQWVSRGKNWAIDVWIFGGAGVCWLALLASAFCRGKLRVGGIISGFLMSWFWWVLWGGIEFARSYTPFGTG